MTLSEDKLSEDKEVCSVVATCRDAPVTPGVTIEDACRLIPHGQSKKYKAKGNPAGGAYNWTATGGISIVGAANTKVVEVKGDTISGAVDDAELKVEYTHSGKKDSDSVKLTVYAITDIKAKIKSTPRLTARAGRANPADYNFTSTETAEAMAVGKCLVLMKGKLQDVDLEATVSPATTPIGWDVKRAGDDSAKLGKATPTVTRDGGNFRKATLKTDERGSFYVRAFGDCKGTNKFQASEAFRLLPLVLVEAKLHRSRSRTHTGHITATVGGGSFRLRTGSFNIAAPNTEAIHMNATVDVVSGGPNGRRHLDRVFAGWINNERANENIRASYAGPHSRFSIFASNRTSATGAGNTFIPGDPAPALVAPPLLDSGRGSPGTGGETATLTRSRVKSKTNRSLGQRWIVESVDSPGDSAPLTHPHFGTALNRYHFELFFSTALAFWTNVSGVSGASGDIADRVYAVIQDYHWDMRGEWTVSALGVVTNVTPMSVAISGPRKATKPYNAGAVTAANAAVGGKKLTNKRKDRAKRKTWMDAYEKGGGAVTGRNVIHDPAFEAHDVNCEVRPPTGLSLLANDGRT